MLIVFFLVFAVVILLWWRPWDRRPAGPVGHDPYAVTSDTLTKDPAEPYGDADARY